jgi:DNA-binding transcriptional ArsR family regulator
MEARDANVVTLDSFERLLWWLFAGSAGAKTRALVLFSLREQPKNAQQLSQSLHLDYTTVRHHLRVLETNKIVLAEGDKYGRIYFVSENMESHWPTLEGILKRAHTKPRG